MRFETYHWCIVYKLNQYRSFIGAIVSIAQNYCPFAVVHSGWVAL